MKTKTWDGTVEAVDQTIPASGYLTVTKVIREHHELRLRKGFGESIGQLIDSHIAEALQKGDEVQELTFGFSPEQWETMRRNI